MRKVSRWPFGRLKASQASPGKTESLRFIKDVFGIPFLQLGDQRRFGEPDL